MFINYHNGPSVLPLKASVYFKGTHWK